MEPGGSMQPLQGLSNHPYPESNPIEFLNKDVFIV